MANKSTLTPKEKERRRKRFSAMNWGSVVMVLCGGGYFLLMSQDNLPRFFSSTIFLMGSIISLIGGMIMQLFLFRCPFCGAPINVRSNLLRQFYACPHCDFRADGVYETPEDPSTQPVQTAKFFRALMKIIPALLVVWFIVAIILCIAKVPGPVILRIMGTALLVIILVVWSLHCPQCGSWIATQTPVWKFHHFKCCKCDFDINNKR